VERPEPAERTLDLLVVGAGPTAIAIGAEARRAGLSALLVDRGPLCAAIVGFPDDMLFFTTRDRLEIAGVPFAIPEDKPNRRQALAYYQGVVRRHRLDLALYEEVDRVRRGADGTFAVDTHATDGSGRRRRRRARAVALATGYFDNPNRLGAEGEDLPWVRCRYRRPWDHFGQHVVVVGGGNSAAETALDLWRHGARVTIVHRRSRLKPSIKYWLLPDVENRIAEGSIDARFDAVVTAFREAGDGRQRGLELRRHDGATSFLPADVAYVLIGYQPDVGFLRRCGIEVDDATLVPAFDAATCETNVPGLYVAGTLQAGRRTNVIFIENARDHGARIVGHLRRRQRREAGQRGRRG